MLGQAEQMHGQLASGPAAQLLHSIRSVSGVRGGTFLYSGPLALNPGALLLGKQLSMATGSPPWNGDANASVWANANDISPGPRMTDEFHETITIVLRHES